MKEELDDVPCPFHTLHITSQRRAMWLDAIHITITGLLILVFP